MNIKTDLRSIPLNGVTAGRGDRIPSSREAAPPVPAYSHAPGIKRSMSDALSIAQMSQNVIQRALSIALRLKSIASAAIATGDIDRRALDETMIEIRSALGERAPIAPPASISTPAAFQSDVDFPAIGDELKLMRDAAESASKGDYTPIKNIDHAMQKLDEKMLSYAKIELDVTERLKSAAGVKPGTHAGPAILSYRIMAGMESDPVTALKAQGNITTAAADRLMA